MKKILWLKLFQSGKTSLLLAALMLGLLFLTTTHSATAAPSQSSAPSVTTQDSQNKNVYVADRDNTIKKIDGRSGKVIWQYELADSQAAQTIRIHVDSNTCYVVNTLKGLTALNANDGSLRWQKDLTGLNIYDEVATNGMIYLHTNLSLSNLTMDKFLAIAANGTEKWSRTDIPWTPYSLNVINDTVYIKVGHPRQDSTALYTLNAATGKTRWQHDMSPALDTDNLVVANGIVYGVATDFLGWQQPTLVALKQTTGQALWQEPAMQDYTWGTIRVEGGMVYANLATTNPDPAEADNRIYTFNAFTGAPGWKIGNDYHFLTDVPLIHGTLLVERDTADTQMIEALDARSGKVRWQMTSCSTTACASQWAKLVANRLLVLQARPEGTTLLNIDPYTGKLLDQIEIKGFFNALEAWADVNNGVIYVRTDTITFDPSGRPVLLSADIRAIKLTDHSEIWDFVYHKYTSYSSYSLPVLAR
jgi:outer membrane protein assembly factor BamB